jgi:acetyl/propionyl-CoA carboxylase alpha subunit
MDELSGTTMVDSGTSPANNGTLTNVTVGVPGLNGTTGYGFTRGYVSVPSQSSLNPGSANLTVTVSANPSSLPTSGDFDVIRKGDSPAQQYKMEILQSGALTCGFRGSIKSATVTSTATIAPNTGYHTLKCIKTTYQIKASLDGVVTALNAKVGSISSSQPVVIGAHGNGTYDFYKGSLDEASITVG